MSWSDMPKAEPVQKASCWENLSPNPWISPPCSKFWWSCWKTPNSWLCCYLEQNQGAGSQDSVFNMFLQFSRYMKSKQKTTSSSHQQQQLLESQGFSIHIMPTHENNCIDSLRRNFYEKDLTFFLRIISFYFTYFSHYGGLFLLNSQKAYIGTFRNSFFWIMTI